MPLSFAADHRKRRTMATGTGIVTLADIVLYLVVCIRDQVYDFDQLIDLRQVDALATDPEEILRLAIQERQRLPPESVVYTALVVEIGTETFAVAQQLARGFARDGIAVRVFTHPDEGIRWLDRSRSERRQASLESRS